MALEITDANFDELVAVTGDLIPNFALLTDLPYSTLKEQLTKHPELIVFEAVKGMLGKNTLGRKQLTKLKVVIGPNHGHEAQKPQPLTFKL